VADDAPVGMLVVGLACDVVPLLSADNGEQVVIMTVGVSAQVRQSDAMIVLLQEVDDGTAEEVGNSYDDIGGVIGEGQLVTVAVAKTVIVLRDNGEHVEWVKVIVLM